MAYRFSGSAGLAIVMLDAAAIFVDGRYTIAVRDQVDTQVITPVAIADEKPEPGWAGTCVRKAGSATIHGSRRPTKCAG